MNSVGRFPSGQREQTVNLPSQTSMVRIHPCPPKSFSLPGRHILREWRNWQTRMIQVHVFVRTCRFKSCFPHHGTLEKSRVPIFVCAEIPKPYPNDTQSSHVFRLFVKCWGKQDSQPVKCEHGSWRNGRRCGEWIFLSNAIIINFITECVQ